MGLAYVGRRANIRCAALTQNMVSIEEQRYEFGTQIK